jgi:SAM-dependent methyltransferase
VFSRGLILSRGLGIDSVLDLGCGSAKPGIALAKTGVSYVGVDIQDEALDVARGNLARNRFPLNVYKADVLNETWYEAMPEVRSLRVQAIVGNLPYLPARPEDELPIEVDGGLDGLKFLPDSLIRVAQRLAANYIVINISSLADIGEFSRKVALAGLGIVRIVACIAPLERYAQKCLAYLATKTFPKIYGPPADSRQVIYALTLRRDEGISCSTAFDQIKHILKPDSNPIGTIVEGISNW